jgi:hypothetical protein
MIEYSSVFMNLKVVGFCAIWSAQFKFRSIVGESPQATVKLRKKDQKANASVNDDVNILWQLQGKANAILYVIRTSELFLSLVRSLNDRDSESEIHSFGESKEKTSGILFWISLFDQTNYGRVSFTFLAEEINWEHE